MSASKILSNLNGIPMFKMSLGSKELFHSNFLEYLWDVDSNSFKKMICDLLGEDKVFKSDVEYKLSREKENFDLCIYHEIGSKLEYDVIIENKVKSIPSKQQLDCYVEKVKGSKSRFLLLSLIENFFDRVEIEKEKLWKIVHYDALRTGIDNNYKGVIGKDATYISDYCSFISNMHSLQQKIVPGNFINEDLWPDYELYKQYRLHDLYIKLRGLKFIELLQAKFCNAGLSYEIVPVGGFKFRQSWNPGEKKDVYLNWNVFRAVGQVAVYLYNGGEQIYEIVIQGDQYRHGINYYDPKDKNISLQDIWKKVKNDDFMKDIQHAGRKNKDYGQYKPDYVYVYERIQSTKIGALLDRIVDDIRKQNNANRP